MVLFFLFFLPLASVLIRCWDQIISFTSDTILGSALFPEISYLLSPLLNHSCFCPSPLLYSIHLACRWSRSISLEADEAEKWRDKSFNLAYLSPNTFSLSSSFVPFSSLLLLPFLCSLFLLQISAPSHAWAYPSLCSLYRASFGFFVVVAHKSPTSSLVTLSSGSLPCFLCTSNENSICWAFAGGIALTKAKCVCVCECVWVCMMTTIYWGIPLKREVL